MKNKNNNYGITLVELIIVMAIIAIFTAITIPWAISTNSAIRYADEEARGFYYILQNELNELKLSDNITLEKFRILFNSDGSINVLKGFNNDFSIDFDLDNTLYNKINTMINKKLKNFFLNNNKSGYYGAFVDDKFRVLRTYWSQTIMYDSDFQKFSSDTDIAKTERPNIGTFPYCL